MVLSPGPDLRLVEQIAAQLPDVLEHRDALGAALVPEAGGREFVPQDARGSWGGEKAAP